MSSQAMFYFVNILSKIFTDNKFDADGVELNFIEICTRKQYWQYLQKAFLPTIYREGITDTFYYKTTDAVAATNITSNRFILPNIYPYMLGQSLYLGPPRFRQIRVRNGTCKIHKLFQKNFNRCFGEYSFSNEDHSPFQTKDNVV